MFLSIASLLAIVLLTIVLAKRRSDRRELEQHSIAQARYSLWMGVL